LIWIPTRWLVPQPLPPPSHLEHNPSDYDDGSTIHDMKKQKNPSMTFAALAGMGRNGAYIPFGAGQRNCIGTGFAMMEAVLVMASILQKYKLIALPGSNAPTPVPRITLRPSEVRLIMRRRCPATSDTVPTDL